MGRGTANLTRASGYHSSMAGRADERPSSTRSSSASGRGRWWRRGASYVRRGLYRLATPIDRVIHWKSQVLLPPAHLRWYYYRGLSATVFARACADAREELIARGLRPEHRVLDIGSGIGNLALGLVGYLRGGYDGVEIHAEAVAWCQRAITPRYPTFRFHRADLASHAYNPRGGLPATVYRFPFPDRSFDVIFLGSVFTHMLPESVEHYLHEISRLLTPGGICVASFFLLNDETRDAVHAGTSFIPFRFEHSSTLCRLHNPSVPEAAVALEEHFVQHVLDEVGLHVRDSRRGTWWRGLAHDQDVLTLVPNQPRAVPSIST